MNLNTHTDAKTESLSSTTNVLHADSGITMQVLPEQWVEIEADLPGTGLKMTEVRMRGRTLTIESVRSRADGQHRDAEVGIERVTTRVVLQKRPRGPVTSARQPSGSIQIRVPLNPSAADGGVLRATDGIGGIAADSLVRSRAMNPTDFLSYRTPMSFRNGAEAYRSPE